MPAERSYPELPIPDISPIRPISFVVVRFCDEYLHNFLPSECAKNSLNEVIEVDNRSNLFFDNLSSAINCGVRQAIHELIAVVHEDVRLVDGWQQRFEQSLARLEEHDDRWAMIGSVGWSVSGTMHGHWSDPFRYANTFNGSQLPFTEVKCLDEQLLIFHRSRLPDFDEQLPGIHHIGRDLSIGMRKSGLKTYAIDAPTIHKYKDRNGRLVLSHEESEKIQDRNSLTYLADKACCDNYMSRKWPELTNIYNESREFEIPFAEPGKLSQLDRPIVLLSRGGSGSRLLSLMVEDLGVFLGNELNDSGDSIEMVISIYRAITEKYLCKANWQKGLGAARIRASAASMIKDLQEDRAWGFKLPESLLLIPEIEDAFPEAVYIHQIRDPATTCLRRTHMTARLDNHIGRITLPQAYDYLKLPRTKILSDSPAVHMAYTTIHQLGLVEELKSSANKNCFFQIRFEDIIQRPREELLKLGKWLSLEPISTRITDYVDPNRAYSSETIYPKHVASDILKILDELRRRMLYRNFDYSL